VIKKGWLGKYRLLKDRELLDKIIVADLLSLDTQTIENNLKSPIIAIVSTLDTDVTAIRYNHHQLWGLIPEVLDSYGANIKAEHLGITPIDESLKDQYWIEQDLQITQKVLGLGYDLPQSKALLMYQIFGLVCGDLGINIADIPVFFHLSPKEEIMQAGNAFSFLDVLSAVNSPDKKHIYRLLTKQDNPWAISTSCPKCGQASKTIIYTKIMDETRTIRISCKQRVYDFKNERGDGVSSHGCGNVSYLEIPRGTKKLFEFIQNHDITIHFPTRSTIYTLLDSSVTPICMVAGDLGLEMGKDNQVRPRKNVPSGYGDHLDMLISSILFQDCILDIENYDTILGRYLTLRGVYLSHTQTVFCYAHQTKLVDREIANTEFPEVFVSDTSILKYIDRGNSLLDLFHSSISLYPFGLSDAKRLRNLKHHLIQKHSELTY